MKTFIDAMHCEVQFDFDELSASAIRASEKCAIITHVH